MNEVEIKQYIADNPITLFMKGTKEEPRCGFSSVVVQILDAIGVSYATLDVLADDALRENIKNYSNWPTIPQLYINSEFIGGADIVRSLAESGELQQLFRSKSLL